MSRDQHTQSSTSVRDVEVRAITYRRFGVRRHGGHLEYRTLATRGFAYPSFWLEYRKQDGFGAVSPLCVARTKERLMEKLRREASGLGHVVGFVEVHHA